MEEARRAAGVTIADVGRRIEPAREKAQFDEVSYDPAEAERIKLWQGRGEALFAQAQAAFDAAEEAQIATAPSTAGDYDTLAQKFLDAQRLAGEAAGPIEEAERMRAILDSSKAAR